MPAAVMTTEDLVAEHITPTNRAKIMVKTIRTGRPYLRTNSVQQPTTHDIAISRTERMIIAGVEPNILRKDSLFIAHTHTRVVRISCRLSRVYTFLMKLRLDDPARSSSRPSGFWS